MTSETTKESAETDWEKVKKIQFILFSKSLDKLTAEKSIPHMSKLIKLFKIYGKK